ncbi:transmembrane protein, putative [Medicago truncatula]|uniref:Transmembrane protein, putative n=1 Tax=Medicago truncatula TaxID=3880 RepID=A0A072TK90_MEDTR|nr:transmembrane protein, putative [Medicago truncatula]
MAIFKHEPPTCVSGLKRFKLITGIIFMLFYALILFVAGETTNFFGDKVEKYPFAMSSVLVLIVIKCLILVISVVLEDPPLCLVQTMVLMVISCVSSWMVGIFIVVVQRWENLVQQMKDIRNVVANKFFSQSNLVAELVDAKGNWNNQILDWLPNDIRKKIDSILPPWLIA